MAGRRKSVSKEIQQAWLEYRDNRLDEGVSLWKIAEELRTQESIECSQRTIYFYLNPVARRSSNLSRSRSAHRKKTHEKIEKEKVARNKIRRRKKELERYHRNRNKDPEHFRTYRRNYGRLYRPGSQQRLIQKLFSKQSVQSLTEIADTLPSLVESIRFLPETIEKRLLKSYEAKQSNNKIKGLPFLKEISPGIWNYS